MEKLQQAIQQARKERQAAAQPKAQAKGRAASTDSGAPDTDLGPWDQIDRFEPSMRHLKRGHILAHETGPDSPAFDVLRTKLVQQMELNNWRRLVITSATPGCGKTTLAANLAFGIARQQELSAILIDLDFRRPNLGKLIGYKPQHDVSAVLMGKVDFTDQAVRIGDRVAVSCIDRASGDPTRYLTSQRTKDCLAELEDRFQPDLVIFDTPPVLVNDDTRSFLPNTDCAMLVARAESTTAKQIDLSEREIADNSNMIGVVLNQCRFADEAQGYGYGYATY